MIVLGNSCTSIFVSSYGKMNFHTALAYLLVCAVFIRCTAGDSEQVQKHHALGAERPQR
jgi:Ca2+/Na+ antiporter